MSATPPEIEADFVACLLHLDAPRVQRLESLVGPADLDSAVYAAMLAAIQTLAAQGLDPVPGAVVAELERTGTVPRHRSAPLVADLYTMCTAPVMARWFGLRVLEAGLRRRVGEAGARLTQAAETAPVDAFADLAVRETSDVLALVQRIEEGGHAAATH
jgi:hypothetical protein